MPSSISSTCEQNSPSVNNHSSIPSSVVSSETRPKRYSRTSSSFFRDEPMFLPPPIWSVLQGNFVTVFFQLIHSWTQVFNFFLLRLIFMRSAFCFFLGFSEIG